jgi:hypothetical protein
MAFNQISATNRYCVLPIFSSGLGLRTPRRCLLHAEPIAPGAINHELRMYFHCHVRGKRARIDLYQGIFRLNSL